jgi:hypothetical protein
VAKTVLVLHLFDHQSQTRIGGWVREWQGVFRDDLELLMMQEGEKVFYLRRDRSKDSITIAELGDGRLHPDIEYIPVHPYRPMTGHQLNTAQCAELITALKSHGWKEDSGKDTLTILSDVNRTLPTNIAAE